MCTIRTCMLYYFQYVSRKRLTFYKSTKFSNLKLFLSEGILLILIFILMLYVRAVCQRKGDRQKIGIPTNDFWAIFIDTCFIHPPWRRLLLFPPAISRPVLSLASSVPTVHHPAVKWRASVPLFPPHPVVRTQFLTIPLPSRIYLIFGAENSIPYYDTFHSLFLVFPIIIYMYVCRDRSYLICMSLVGIHIPV